MKAVLLYFKCTLVLYKMGVIYIYIYIVSVQIIMALTV